jgi:hypothetical protein
LSALRAEGRLRSSGRARAWARLAAVLALAVVSLLAGARLRDRPREGVAKPRFVLLISADPTPLASSEEAKRVDEYRRWAIGIHEEGHGITGEKLGDARLTLGGPGAATAGIGGFFVIEARDLEEAARLASGCPHLKYGGSIEVRPIDPT